MMTYLILIVVGAVAVVCTYRLDRAARNSGPGDWNNLVSRIGAPPLPWPPREIDREFAKQVAELFDSVGMKTVVTESDGPTGTQIEIGMIGAAPGDDPLAILTRTWNPDDRRMATMLVFGFDVTPDNAIQIYLISGGYRRLSPIGTAPSVFVSST